MPVSIQYLGIDRPIRCVFTDVLGLWPGIFTLDFTPQPGLPAIIGDLSLGDGNGGFLTIRNCKVDQASVARTSNGDIEHIRGFDPRWTWEFGEINGVYNLRNPDGTLNTATEKTPQQLATMLFEALGVSDADVSSLPNATRPYVNWRSTTPRPHLQQLLDSLGCTVAMDWVLFRPVVVQFGVGTALPNGPIQTNSFGLDLAESPSSIKLYGQRNLYQTKFKLQMVVPDAEGVWQDYDDVVTPEQLEPDPDDTTALGQNLRRWYGKAYRIETHSDGEMYVPGYGLIASIEQCLPLEDGLIETYVNVDGTQEALDPILEGTYWIDEVEDDTIPTASNTADFTRISDGFTIDRNRGMVFFSKRVMKVENDAFTQADLYLTISHRVWDAETGQYRSASASRVISSSPAGALPQEVDYISLHYIGEYDDAELVSVSDNESETALAFQVLLDALQSQYQPQASVSRKYVGIGYIQLDGLRRQATYRVHYMDGANTWAYLNSEAELGVAKLRELRRIALVQRGRQRRLLTRDEGEST